MNIMTWDTTPVMYFSDNHWEQHGRYTHLGVTLTFRIQNDVW